MASTTIVTSIVMLLPTSISIVLIPTKENCKIASAGISLKANLPSEFVTVPCVVPLIITVTPGNGWPSGSATLPETDFCLKTCAGCAVLAFSLGLSKIRKSSITLYEMFSCWKISSKICSTVSFCTFTEIRRSTSTCSRM